MHLFLKLLIALFLVCCSSSTEEQSNGIKLSPEQQEVQQLEKVVLQIHDEVMPLMGTLVKLKGQLENRNQSLAASNDSKAEEAVILNNMVISNLDQAHEEMMGWMRNYKKIDLELDSRSNLNYLEQEKIKIELVQTHVNDAIKSAENALK